ncbi:hypothetical protein BKA80DRAFT_274042 [Phyllosticta citrichinensis]
MWSLWTCAAAAAAAVAARAHTEVPKLSHSRHVAKDAHRSLQTHLTSVTLSPLSPKHHPSAAQLHLSILLHHIFAFALSLSLQSLSASRFLCRLRNHPLLYLRQRLHFLLHHHHLTCPP